MAFAASRWKTRGYVRLGARLLLAVPPKLDFGRFRRRERIFHALPDMVRNFYTVSAWPGHERNLMVPDFAADRCDRVAEGQDRFRIPCGSSGLEVSIFIE